MNRAVPPPFSIIAMLALSLCGNALHADQKAVTDDGREVLLRDDGSWEYTGHTPMIPERPPKTAQAFITLQKTVIEKHETKVQKNKRVRTQTVF